MNNKQKAVIGVGILVLVFIGIAIWYMATHQAPTVFVPQTATSTPATTATGPQHLTATGKYYDIDTQYPGSTVLAQTAGTQADIAAVSTMKTFLAQEIDQFKANGNLDNLTPEDVQIQGLGPDRKYALQATYKTYQGPHTVSYVYTLYEDTLGAHPNAYYRTFTFDTKTGAALTLGDLFSSGTYLQVLSTAARADLPKIISDHAGGDADLTYINTGTTPNADNFQNWYLDGGNLVLVFAPYQVGPYALGTITDPISLVRLGTILKATYKPEPEFSVHQDRALNIL